jgi:hypothetical protein
VLAEAGHDVEQAVVAFRAIVAFVLGFVMMESAGLFGGVSADRDPDELLAMGLPRLAELVPHLAGRGVDLDFDAGLRLVEAGALVTFGGATAERRQPLQLPARDADT